MNSTDGEAPESACDLTISDGASDTKVCQSRGVPPSE